MRMKGGEMNRIYGNAPFLIFTNTEIQKYDFQQNNNYDKG
jgi:hypothetical protein